MTPELMVLTLTAILQCGQFVLYSVLANMQVDLKTSLGPRDTPVELIGFAGRAKRAMNNHFEGLILFSIAVFVITISDQSTATTRTAAWAFLVARILYVPAYAFGLSPWRSLIWMVGFLATAVMLLAALF